MGYRWQGPIRRKLEPCRLDTRRPHAAGWAATCKIKRLLTCGSTKQKKMILLCVAAWPPGLWCRQPGHRAAQRKGLGSLACQPKGKNFLPVSLLPLSLCKLAEWMVKISLSPVKFWAMGKRIYEASLKAVANLVCLLYVSSCIILS